jgi:toxin ParE1/3/4
MRRYILAPEAGYDLVLIWRYLKAGASIEVADRIERAIRDKIIFLAGTPGAGHLRKDLTEAPVKFFPVYSYLIVYRPETKPLQVVAILHGYRDVEYILGQRLGPGLQWAPHTGKRRRDYLSSISLYGEACIAATRSAPVAAGVPFNARAT